MPAADSISDALERVMVRFDRMLRAIGRRRGLGEADLDELAQEVRLRLWRALAEREKIEQVRTSYVHRAAVTAALDMIRRRRRRPEEPIEADSATGRAGTPSHVPPARSAERPDVALEQRELGERIDRAVERLREPRDVVVRLHLSGYDRFEIARLLGWSEPKVRNLIYRGLADLRAALEREGVGPQRVT